MAGWPCGWINGCIKGYCLNSTYHSYYDINNFYMPFFIIIILIDSWLYILLEKNSGMLVDHIGQSLLGFVFPDK